MANEPYSVGNLQISFSALDKTGEDFKVLAKNLRAVINLINRISTADLGKFTANVKEITRAFSPFLNKIKGATVGLQAFNDVAKQVGIKNMSAVSKEIDDIQQSTQNATESQEELTRIINNNAVPLEKSLTLYKQLSNASEEFGYRQEETAERTRKSYMIYNEALSAMGDIASAWHNMYAYMNYGDGEFATERLQSALNQLSAEYLRNKQIIDDTNEAFRRMTLTEQELFVYDNKQSEIIRKKRIEYLKLALATKQAGENAEAYMQELRDLSRQEYEFERSMKQLEQTVAPIISQFDEATARIRELKKQLSEMAYATGALDTGLVHELQSLTTNIDNANEAVKRALMTEQEKVIADYQAEQSARRQRIAYLEAALAMGKAGDQTKEFRQELKRLRKEDGQHGKKSGLSKFLGQVKRISIYRLIRGGLKSIASAAKEGIGAYAQFDSSINQTMSQLKTSTTIIKTSFGATLIPILQAVTPIIQQISVGFANMANVINASMSKTGKYTKINTDRLLAYNKATSLFDFDKFRSLSKGDEATGLLSTENVEDLNDELGNSASIYHTIYDIIKNIGELLANAFTLIRQILDAASPFIQIALKIVSVIIKIVSGLVSILTNSGLIYPIVYSILGVLIAMGVSKIITYVTSGALLKGIKEIGTSLVDLGKKIKSLNTTTLLWGVALAAVVGAWQILSNWDNFNSETKNAIIVISSLVTVLTTAAIAAMALKGALTAGIAVPLIVTAVAAGAVAIGGIIKGYANGGNPQKGDLFYANENGPELIYKQSNGQTSVNNLQQLAQAVYQGTYQATMDWWAKAKNEIGGDVYLDGEKIYQNTTSRAKKHGQKWAIV